MADAEDTRGVAGAAGSAEFTATHWSVVLAAAQQESPQAAEALERLCRTYWYPLYAHVRRRGYAPEDAQDLTQEFFARLLAKQWLSQANPSRGRFRTFLLAALDHFLANDWNRRRCEKRGGGQTAFSLDGVAAETRYRLEPVDPADAGRLYERRWALTLLDRVLERLRQESSATGRPERFEPLQPFLLGDKTGQWSASGRRLWLLARDGACLESANRRRNPTAWA